MAARRPAWQRAAAALLAVVAVLYAGAAGWVKWNEPELVFLTAMSKAREVGQLPAGAQRIEVPSRSGLALAGVLMPADPARDRGWWVLHLHGNSVSAFSPWELRHVQQLSQWGVGVLALDYRGFGQSPGEASEQNLMEDAQDAWALLRERGVPANRILIWGHSLGSGPATWLASQQPDAAALVLFGAFTSVPDAGADDYPWLPVRLLASIRFDSLARISTLRIPVVVAHSPQDARIRFVHGQRLFEAAREPKRFVSVAPVSDDHWGGHVDALYDQLSVLDKPLDEMLGQSFTAPLGKDAVP